MHSNEVPISLLKFHPKNMEYFSPPSDEVKNILRRSIAYEGIRDPLKVTPDYVVIAGHIRLEIAKELGMEKVPVQIVDGDPEYLEYLLIADNDERRNCGDAIKKAKRAQFFARYWGVRQGSLAKPGTPEGKFSPQVKTLADVAKAVGESEANLKKILKLNDLVPELQELVSSGKLGQTAAYELAFLSPDTQKQLLSVYGEKITELKQVEAKDLRRKIESEIRAEAEREANELRAKIDELDRQRRELQVLHEERESELKKAIVDLQESLRESVSPEKASYLEGELQRKEKELACAQAKLADIEDEYKSELAKLRRKIKELESEKTAQPEVVEKIVEKVVEVPDPKQQSKIEELEKQTVLLKRDLAEAKAGSETRDKLNEEIKRLEAEKSVLEREVNRGRSVVNFTTAIRKLMNELEKKEVEIATLATQVEISDAHFIEAQKWINLLGRYQEYIRTVLGKGKVIDITPLRRDQK